MTSNFLTAIIIPLATILIFQYIFVIMRMSLDEDEEVGWISGYKKKSHLIFDLIPFSIIYKLIYKFFEYYRGLK